MRYNPALDGVRALAVLAVVAHHALVPGFENGRGGVDVFFVLSGFLITTLLVAEQEAGGIRLGAFYLRRARRLYPALFLLVALVMAFAAFWTPAPTWRDATIALLYLSDYTAAYGELAEPIKHTWSLSVEEHYYLLWPLAVMGLCRLPRRTAVLLLAGSYVIATAWRLHIALHTSDWIAYYRFDTRLSGLLLGSLLAMVPRVRLPYPALAAVLGVVTLAEAGPMYLIMLPSEWLGACLVLWAMQGSRLLAWGPLPYLGRISYGIYLFHWPVAMFVRGLDWPVTLAVTLAGGVLLAAASHATVERAFRKKPAAVAVPA